MNVPTTRVKVFGARSHGDAITALRRYGATDIDVSNAEGYPVFAVVEARQLPHLRVDRDVKSVEVLDE